MTPGRRIGRFILQRELGKGAQATVWLAVDPRLEREVAVKLLHDGKDAASIGDWLHEARNVSRLTHPHIVPVFEADEHEGLAYMVFEYVPGPTLAERIRKQGAMPPRQAVTMLLGVLEALQAAHAAGLVHRDLKPSNILVDAEDRARVMDFGIAARLRDANGKTPADDRRIVGTPGYMSPEAARGDVPSPVMDVFAAGMVLIEMLAAAPVLRERDPYRALHRVQHEDLPFPATLDGAVDDALRALLRRAIARDAAERFPSAAALHGALLAWLNPAPVEAVAASSKGTLDFLLRRMRHKSDFPALSDSVSRIQRVANSDSESIASLSNAILKDVALTNKLLRVVNTVQYRHAGGGTISTVSRAVALVGFAGIRNMALSLVLLEHMSDKTHAGLLKEEFLRSLMAGSIAGELSVNGREGEEAFIGAIFQNLGRLLTEFYFPEEAREVRGLVRAPAQRIALSDAHTPRTGMTEAQASLSVLGLSFEELGQGVAKSWGLPEALQRCMSRPDGDPPKNVTERDRLRWLTSAANDVADALLYTDPALVVQRLDAIAERCAKPLGLSPKEMLAAVERSRERLAQMASAMNLHFAASSPARRLLDAPKTDVLATQVMPAPAPDTITQHALQATVPMGDAPTQVLDKAGREGPPAAEMLAAGIQDITNSMVSDSFRLNEVLRMILETMFRALGFRRVIFCLRDPKTESLTGRFGLGDSVETTAAAFCIALRPKTGSPDLFGAVCLKGVDTLIADATMPNIAARLPDWYKQGVNAPAFLLLPLLTKGAPFALIYADKAKPGGIELGEKELNLLRTLRNQAVMAFRQST